MELAPRAGFEPATNRLTAGCSTAELPGKSLLGVVEAAYNKADPGLKAAPRRHSSVRHCAGKTNPKRRRKSLRPRAKSRPPHAMLLAIRRASSLLSNFAVREGQPLSRRAISNYQMDRSRVRVFAQCLEVTANTARISPGRRSANHARPPVGKRD